MKVLIVDDQLSIISGLISGIDWDALGITGIETSCSAEKAKAVLLSEPVDILLCDIEMPLENGLSLLRWVRKRGMELECIFLTSHADFVYAKEAIQLDSFDYILQPARYEDIQLTIMKAIRRIELRRADQSLASYARQAKSYRFNTCQGIFKSWCRGQAVDVNQLAHQLQLYGYPVKPGSICLIAWFHLQEWLGESWPTQLLNFAADNILSEIYGEMGLSTVSFAIDDCSFGFLVYSAPEDPWPKDYTAPLERTKKLCADSFGCKAAIYYSAAMPLNRLAGYGKSFLSHKLNNVDAETLLFQVPGELNQVDKVQHIELTELIRWEKLLAEKRGLAVEQEALSYLEERRNNGQLSLATLQSFTRSLQQIVLSAAYSENLLANENSQLLFSGPETLLAVRNYAHTALSHFTKESEIGEYEVELITKIKRHIADHLDEPLYVNEVAEAFYLHPDYITRMFKQREGKTIKEYITDCKMRAAQTLLRSTALPVSIVAAKLGYDNFSHFSQVYKKTTGRSPSEERKP